MDNPVHDCIGDGLFTDGFMPVVHRDLRGHNGRAGIVPIVNHLHQKTSGDAVERAKGEVIKNEEIGPLDTLKISQDLTRCFRRLEHSHQPGGVRIDDPIILLARTVSESSSNIGLACTRAAGYEDVLLLFDERKV